MDEYIQVVELCGVCSYKRVYNDYHRIYNPCKTCVAKNSARYYQTKRV